FYDAASTNTYGGKHHLRKRCYTSRYSRFTITYYFHFFNDTASAEIYTLSLHDALPISAGTSRGEARHRGQRVRHKGLLLPKVGQQSRGVRGRLGASANSHPSRHPRGGG